MQDVNKEIGFKKLKLKDKIFLFILLLFAVYIGTGELFGTKKNNSEKNNNNKEIVRIKIGEISLLTELAISQEEKYQGLSGRDHLDENSGMLFLHEKAGKYPYCMRNMNFPLDFLFIKNGLIIDYQENIPSNFSGDVIGQEEYDSVLEVPAGWIERNKIEKGVRVVEEK